MELEMGGEMNVSVAEANVASLPNAHILSYMTSVGTPTRVRAVAAMGLRSISVGMAVGLFPLLWLLGHLMILEVMMYRSRGGTAFFYSPLWHWMRTTKTFGMVAYIMQTADPHAYLVTGLVGACFCSAMLMFLCAGSVKRGNAVACRLGAGSLVVPMVVAIFGTVVMGLNGLSDVSMGVTRIDPWQLACLLEVPVGITVVLLMGDVVRFTRWIARNPSEEKPRTGFISVPK